MKKILIIICLWFAIFKVTAQSYQQQYNQAEQIRLSNANSTETDIENFINQNINTYDFTETINKVNTIKDENGNLLTGSAYDNALLAAKKERLRSAYFEANPEKLQYYLSGTLQQCVNGGFEDNGGSVNGYSFFHKKISTGWAIFNNNTNDPIIASPSTKATLVDNSGNDPFVNIPRVNAGSTHAIRIGNSNYIGNDYDFYYVTKMTRTFVVNESSISFAFALVLQDGGKAHVNDNTNPYYQVRLVDSNNQTVFIRNVMANAANPLFQQSNGILFTNWACEKISTARYMGQTVRLEIILSDCGHGGHWGYGYFDDFCGFTCDMPAFNPGITLNPLKKECPNFPLPVSGNVTLPANASFTNVTLEILDASNAIVGTKVITTAPAGVFSTTLDYSDFYPSGPNSNLNFNIRALLNYTISGLPQSPVSVTNTNPPGPDVSFKNCVTPCYEEWIFNNNQPIVNSINYQASCCITSASIIYPNLNVDFRAGFEITLKPGFFVTGNTTGKFHAYLAPCEENFTSRLQQNTSKISQGDLSATNNPDEIKIFPNPASDFINIDPGKEKIISWELFDISGKRALKGNSSLINIQSLPRANYILKINTVNKQVTKKVTVK